MVPRLHVLLISTSLFISACGDGKKIDFRDRTAPQVLSILPADGSLDVPTGSEVTVIYDEALRTQSFDMTSLQVSDAAGNVADGFLAINNDQIIFRASQPLAYSTLYTVRLSNNIRDLFGNRGIPFESTFTTVPDREPPSAPYNLFYNPLTNLTTATISGAKDPGTTLALNKVKVSANPASAVFEVSVDLPNEGANTFELVATDEAGNESEVTLVMIERDQTAPAGLELCAGSSGVAWHSEARHGCWVPPGIHPDPIYWNNPELPIGGMWTPGENEVAFVRFGSTTHSFGSSPFSLDLLSQGIPAAPVTLVMGARDLAGNETIALRRTFIYDATPPTLYPNFSASSLAVTGDADGALEFTKGEAPFTESIAFFATLDGTPAGSCLAGICTIPYANLSEGLHQFVVAATDAAGNSTTIYKTLTVDKTKPTAIVVPRAGTITGNAPTLHVFAQEPVTASSLTLTGLQGTLTRPAIEDTTSLRRHWSYTTSGLSPGNQQATVSLRDAAGNVTDFSWSFTSGTTPAALISAEGFSGPATNGARDGTVTFTGLPTAAAANVLVFQKNNTSTSKELLATTTSTLIAVAEPLSMFDGTLYTYNEDGAYTTAVLNEFPWNHGGPATWVTYTSLNFASGAVPFPYYGSAFSYSAGNAVGFNLITDDAYWFRLDNATNSLLTNEPAGCSGQDILIHPPFALSATRAVAGVENCDGTEAVDVLELNHHTRSPIWTPPQDASTFGATIAMGDLFGTNEQIFAVGAPGGSGKVFLYAGLTTDTPTLALHPTSDFNAGFGRGVAIAANHLPGTATLSVLRARRQNFPAAIYFYDGEALRKALDPTQTMPIPRYRAIYNLPANTICPAYPAGSLVLPFRHEVISPGDIDGDGSEDFVSASWDNNCTEYGSYYVDKTKLRIFLGGPGTSDNSPIVIEQKFSMRFREEGLTKTRLVAFGDLNGDGRVDFGYADAPANGLIRVFYGDASGTPSQRLLRPFATTPTESFTLNGVMHANGDGYPEFILSKFFDLPLCDWCPQGDGLQLMIWP